MRRAFAVDPDWRGYQLALGSRSARMELTVFSDLTVMSSLLRPISHQKNIETESVDVKRLDDLYADVVAGIDSPRVFLKMDTQGYDLDVFRGASGIQELNCFMRRSEPCNR